MSSLLQHLEGHQSKHQVGWKSGAVLVELEKEGTGTHDIAYTRWKLSKRHSESLLSMVPKGVN